MEMFKRISFWITIIVCIIILILMIYTIRVILCNKETDNAIVFEAIPIYTGVITYVVGIFMESLKKENENKQYWFRNYILDSYLKEYIEIFDLSKKKYIEFLTQKALIIDAEKNVSQYKSEIQMLNEKSTMDFQIKMYSLGSDMEFIKVFDEEFCHRIWDSISMLEDIFVKTIDEEAHNIDHEIDNTVICKIDEEKSKLLSYFYKKSLEN